MVSVGQESGSGLSGIDLKHKITSYFTNKMGLFRNSRELQFKVCTMMSQVLVPKGQEKENNFV